MELMSGSWRPRARWLTGILVGLVVAIVVAASPAFWDTALLAGWDAGLCVYLGSVYWMMARSDAQRTSLRAQVARPATLFTLLVVVATSAVGLLSAVALSARTGGRGDLAQVVHVAIGAVAVFLAWLLVHTEFAMYYARLYYDEATGHAAAADANSIVPFRKGLQFPDAEIVDYWDFMYYAFTIALCYQTSDVTVSAPKMRRVTLLHAILSFVFVVIILGFAINAIGALV